MRSRDTEAKVQFGYDENDRLTRFTDAQGNVTRYAYDEISAASPLITGVTHGRENTPFTQVYDAEKGRVQKQIDAYDNTTELDYGNDGRTWITYPDEDRSGTYASIRQPAHPGRGSAGQFPIPGL